MKTPKYQEYFESTAWKEKKSARFEIDKGKCWCCSHKADAIHHITHIRVRKEHMGDLISVCQRCKGELDRMISSGASRKVVHRELRSQRHPLGSKKPRRGVSKAKKSNPSPERAKRRSLSKSDYRCVCCEERTENLFVIRDNSVHKTDYTPMCTRCLKISEEMSKVESNRRLIPGKVKSFLSYNPSTQAKLLGLLKVHPTTDVY